MFGPQVVYSATAAAAAAAEAAEAVGVAVAAGGDAGGSGSSPAPTPKRRSNPGGKSKAAAAAAAAGGGDTGAYGGGGGGVCGLCHEECEDGVVAECGHGFCRMCVIEYVEGAAAAKAVGGGAGAGKPFVYCLTSDSVACALCPLLMHKVVAGSFHKRGWDGFS